MKKAVIFFAAAVLVLALAACGNRDNKNGNDNTGVTTNGGQNSGSGTNSGSGANGSAGTNSGSGFNGNAGANMGTAGNNGSAGSGGVSNRGNSGLNGNNSTDGSGDNSLANDARRAMDDVGGAVDDLLGTGENGTAGRTSFQRMLDNAKVHDADGILTREHSGPTGRLRHPLKKTGTCR